MKSYWPMAIALDKEKPFMLFTYDSCPSIEDAKKVMKRWQNDYNYVLLSTWIHTDDSSEVIEHRCHIDSLGNVRKMI